jgi:hypothetical protein
MSRAALRYQWKRKEAKLRSQLPFATPAAQALIEEMIQEIPNNVQKVRERNSLTRINLANFMAMLGGFEDEPDWQHYRIWKKSDGARSFTPYEEQIIAQIVATSDRTKMGYISYGVSSDIAQRLGRNSNQIRVKICKMRKAGKLPPVILKQAA